MSNIRIAFEDITLGDSLDLIEDQFGEQGAVAKMLQKAAGFLLDANRKRFLAETDPDGKPWEPSKAGLRRRASGGTGTLFDTGKLFNSIELQSELSKDRRNVFQAETVIGTSGVPYARKHQEGDGVVKRVFLGVGDDDRFQLEELTIAMSEEIEAKLKALK